MLKIGDFSKFCRVSIKALRYYDEIGLLKPVVVDEFTGYRYYAADQSTLVYRIIGLKDLGLTLEEIKGLLTDNLPADKVIELLREKQKEALRILREEESRLRKVEEWLKRVEKEGMMPAYDIVLKKVEAVEVASVRDIIPTYGDIGKLFDELYSFLGKNQAQFTGPPQAIYYDHEYREKEVDVEVAVPISGKLPLDKRITVRQLPGVEHAGSLIHKGPYENFHLAYQALMTWVETGQYHITGPNREVYFIGPGQGNPSSYVTEIQLPVQYGQGESVG
jgi:effector-binding domain-containing protein